MRLQIPCAAALLVALVVTGCGSGPVDRGKEVLVVATVPVSSAPWVADSITRGAQLAVDQLNAAGGMTTADGRKRVRLEVRDNAGSAQTALADARHAVAEHAALLLGDGVGAPAIAGVTDAAALPYVICFEGGDGLVDPKTHPSVYRMAPANQPMAQRVADYVANARPKVALLATADQYGQQGAAALRAALRHDKVSLVADTSLPSGGDVSAQLLSARRAGATQLVVWADAATTAAVFRTSRSTGWDVPVLAGPEGEDPLVRRLVADRPRGLTGLRFVSFRITSEQGPAPFEAFRAAFEKKYGAQQVGVSQDGREVVQPPDWPVFAYDTVLLLRDALTRRLHLLDETSGVSGNGDDRGFDTLQHEGVSPPTCTSASSAVSPSRR